MKYRTLGAVAILLAVSIVCFVPSGDVNANVPSIDVEDGLGNEFSFDSPAEHIMTIGKGFTATAIGIGMVDKIVVCDSYSKTDKDPLFDDLRKLIDEGSIAAGGNIYSGKDQLKNDVINAADPDTGVFDMEKDVVFISVSATYGGDVVSYLKEKGFKNVMQWYDITSYDKVIELVETMSKVCTGGIVSEVDRMNYVIDNIASEVKDNVEVKIKAFYVTYSGNAFKVGNAGSLATSMILAAGGDVITINPDYNGSTYETNLTKLVEENKDVVIFVDNSVATNDSRLSELRTLVGDDTRLVALKAIWNNYCPESLEGVWTMASAMYPDLFKGDIPEIGSGESDTMFYVGIAVSVVIVIAVAAFLLMRRNA